MHLLPEEIREKIETVSGEEVDLAIHSDLGPDGLMGRQWLVTTGGRVFVISPNSGTPEILRQIAIADMGEINAELLIGGGCLIANIRGEYLPLIRYSNAMCKEFGYAARKLQAAIKKEDAPEPTEEDRTRRCDKCDFPLETGSDVCPNCVNKSRAIKRLLAYLHPYKAITITAVILMLASQALQCVPNYMQKILLDDILGQSGPHRPPLSDSLRGHLLQLLGIVVLALVFTRVISMVMGIFQSRITAYVGSKIIHDIRLQLYSSLERLTLAYFDKRQTGAVISRISQDTNALQEFLAFDVQYILANSLMLVLVIGILFWQNWRLAAFTILPAPIASIGAMIVFTRLRWVFSRVWHRWSKLHAVMSDSLQGLRVVKAFAQEDKEVSRFEHRSRALYVANMQAEQTWATLLPIMWFILSSGQFIVWYVGGIGVLDYEKTHITTGTLIMFLGYIGMLYGPLQIVTRMWDWIGRSLAASERIFEIMDSQPEEVDPEKQVKMPEMKGHVKFNKVTFGYDKHRPVLHELDLDVAPGEMIGLVGHSGAGKSTTMSLLARFYIAQDGCIEIDGVDIRDISLEDLRRQVGIVPQESYLFSGTIAENIAYSKPEATPEEIVRAAKAANAHDFIVNFPDGYETQVGERGQSLSGGERQRIAIARAILHDPKILILDEATSSVDTGTEKQIQEALKRLVQNRTTFAIAHRLSTLSCANRLLVLEKGTMVELGTHEELLKKDGVYAKLVKMQTEMASQVAVGG